MRRSVPRGIVRPAALTDMIGKTLSHYRVSAPLGRGGMGEVWVAEDTRLNRRVALKTLPRDVAADPERRSRFEREAQAIAALNHPNIVTIHSVEESEGVSFITMELVEGKTLTELIPHDGLPLDVFLDLAIPLADALSAAHRKGITHRDLKPDNVMVTADGRVKVLDFGLAKLVGAAQATDPPQTAETATKVLQTAAGMVLGTAAYMSPEQAEGRPVDERSDIFSLGAVLYEMLTGRQAFRGDTAAQLIASVLRDEPTPAEEIRGELPPDIGRILARCLDKQPKRRELTAADIRDRLRTVDRQQRATASLTTAIPADTSTGKWSKVLPVAATGLLILVAAGVWYVTNRRSPEGPPQSHTAPFASRRLSQLTFAAEPEVWPAWSPDGTRLVYCRESDGYSKLFVRNLETNETRQLTHGPRDDIQPAWAPDGGSLVFVRSNAERGKLEPAEPLTGMYSDGDVWLLDLESGEETRIVDDAFNPVFSRDGERLAVDASRAGPRRIWTTDARGRNPRQITTDTSEAVAHTRPAWSPDGRRIAYQHQEKTKLDIHVADLRTGARVKVTDDLYLDLDPVWSASGRYLYLSSYRGGGLNIWRIAVGPDGTPDGAPEQLTTGAGQDIQPSLTTDGTRLAFTVLQQNADLWRLPTDPETGRRAGEPEPLAVSTREDSRGAWSPDGRLLAFNSDRDGEMNVWLYSADDGTARPLTRGPGGDYQPRWSPDGSSIAFFSARSGNADIWTVEVATGKLRQVTTHPALDTNPVFSPDGSRIAFQSDRNGRKEVWLAGTDGSGVRQLASAGASDHFMRWSRDGDWLYFRSTSLPENSICRVSLDGHVEPTGIPVGWHMSLSPDESLILDAVGHKGLWVYPVDGSGRREVFVSDDPGVRIDYPDWSPDGRWVVFDRVVPRGADVWLLEGLE